MPVRIGVVQLCSTDDLAANLTRAGVFVREAAQRGCKLIALPENFAFLRREGAPVPCSQALDGEIVGSLRELARELSVWILGGTFPERIDGDERIHNTSVLVDAAGEIAAVYRKMHLFDVDLEAQGGAAYRESERYAPGSEVVVGPSPFGPIGMSVCYDLRFPELYRAQVEQGAVLLAVPSAFTPETGRDHWEVLLRARAIENQAYVIAPAQCGPHAPDRSSYGRSLVIDPWGVVVAQAGYEPALLVADCEPARVEQVRSAIPALRNRRL